MLKKFNEKNVYNHYVEGRGASPLITFFLAYHWVDFVHDRIFSW